MPLCPQNPHRADPSLGAHILCPATTSLGDRFVLQASVSPSGQHGHSEQLTHVVPHQVLHRFELGPSRDVVAARVQLPDFIMLYVVTSALVPVTDGQGVGTWVERVV